MAAAVSVCKWSQLILKPFFLDSEIKVKQGVYAFVSFWSVEVL